MDIKVGVRTFGNYENIKYNAHNTRDRLDTVFRPDENAIKVCRKHLQDCLDYPTVGMIANRAYVRKKPYNLPKYVARNKNIINNNNEIKMFKGYCKEIIETFYPKTKHIRQYIADNDRVVLDFIKPIKKYTSVDKLKLLLRRFI